MCANDGYCVTRNLQVKTPVGFSRMRGKCLRLFHVVRFA